ncbi:MAG: RICIN domain-containing protein [Bryobacteraceae bacterium]
MRKFSLVILLTLSAISVYADGFTTGQAARAVIGQGTFTDGIDGTQQYLLGGASGLAYSGGVLYVADDNRLGANPENNRVLMFDTSQIPGTRQDVVSASHPSSRCWLCGYSAFRVIGQTSFMSSVSGRSDVPTNAAGSMNAPIAVGTDGRVLAIADTDNNRVLLWNNIPPNSTTPPNIVLGQANFTAFQSPQPINANSLRGPQGVWIQNGKLFVADTQNHRVLIWNSIPTSNNQPADVVLGQNGFNVAFAPTVSAGSSPSTTAARLLNPVAVTSDGTHLFVADLGYNRVLIWNQIPTNSAQPADVVIGQPDLTSAVPNYANALCTAFSNGTYPARCEGTLNFPRFVLSDGRRLFVADGGNDRVLIYNTIPTANGAKADVVLGQPDFMTDIVTTLTPSIASTAIDNTGAVDTTPTPTSLAYDGINLYVGDPYNRRVLIFSPGDIPIPQNSIVNWASEIIRQEGSVVVTGTVVADDTVTVSIAGTDYTYTVKSGDSLDSIAQGLVSLINASDPNATAIFQGKGSGGLYLSSKGVNLGFDAISLSASVSNPVNLSIATSGSYLTSGTAATAAPGMLVEINGSNLADVSASNPTTNTSDNLPLQLGNVQVFMDGIPALIASVSPNRIVAQVPFWYNDRNSTSVYVRTVRADGVTTTVTNAQPLYIAPANPGLFSAPAFDGQIRPWPATGSRHQPGNATAVVSIDGTATANDTATISINGTAYTYTVKSGDTLLSIVNGLVSLINADPNVTATVGAAFTRVVIEARSSGAAGTGITIGSSTSSNATVTVTPYTNATCCYVVPNSPITPSNPAISGELIQIDASGLGLLQTPDGSYYSPPTGPPYSGPVPNSAINTVSATMGGSTAQVISAGLPTGSHGRYVVQMVVPADLLSNGATPLYIAQNAFISNTVTVPVLSSSLGIPTNGLANSQILVNPTNLVFANNAIAGVQTRTKTVTITNPSAATLTLGSISISGANGSDFSISNSCGSALSAFSTCTVAVSFLPAAATGVRSASLVVNSSATSSPQSVSLMGVTVSQFAIVSKSTGKVLDPVGLSISAGAGIQQDFAAGLASQKWSFSPVGDGSYVIVNLASGKVLDITSSSFDNGAPIQQYDYLGGANQKWFIVPVESGYFQIVSAYDGKALDVRGNSGAAGTLIQQWDVTGADNQKWTFDTYQAYVIQNVGTSGVLDLPGGNATDGTPIQQWSFIGSSNQQWFVVPVDGQYVTIVSAATGKSLDISGASNLAGALLQEYQSLGGANQQWALNPVGNGIYSLVNRGSGRVLDVPGASSNNGVQLQQYDYLGGVNQQWRLIPVGTPGQ